MKKKKAATSAEKFLGYAGTMLSGSKSIYRHAHPSNVVVFNANVCTKKNKVIWHGDLDLTLSYKKLQSLSAELKTSIYVLYEGDARFSNENSPRFERHVGLFTKNHSSINSQYNYIDKTGIPKQYTSKEIAIKFPPPPKEPTIYDKKDYKSVKLPNLTNFTIIKNTSPFLKFQEYFNKKYGKAVGGELSLKLWVTEEYYMQLETLVKKTVKKTYSYIHPVKLEQTISWEMFNHGPNHFENTPEWAKQSLGYIKLQDTVEK